jgi:hypothetical protein
VAGETGPIVTHFDAGGMQQTTAYELRVAPFNSAGLGEAVVTAEASSTLRMAPHLTPTVVVPMSSTFAAAPAAVPLKSGELLLAFHTGNAKDRRITRTNRSGRRRRATNDRNGRARKSCCAVARRIFTASRDWPACPTAGSA